MSMTIYQASIPVFIRMLENLSLILDKAVVHAEAKAIDPAVFIEARLAPDMYPLNRQIQIATDVVKACAARLAGIEIPSYADTETTFPELQTRIAKTITFLQSVSAEQINGSETRTVTLKLHDKATEFLGQNYLFNFVFPNFYFHMAVAYTILRHNGLEIGKMDFVGNY